MEYTIKGPYKNLTEMYEARKAKENDFPDLGRTFLRMKIQDKLAEVSEKSSFGFAILTGLRNNKPMKAILDMIMDQYECAPNAVLDIVDEATINDIKKLLKK